MFPYLLKRQPYLQEPRNQKLILLSEAGIPLYPPTALYHQLITEEKSRINSCTQPGVSYPPHPHTHPLPQNVFQWS